MDRKKKKKCITTNTNAIWQHGAHNTEQLISPSCYARVIQKAYFLTRNIEEFSGEKSQEKRPSAKTKNKNKKRTRQKEQQE